MRKLTPEEKTKVQKSITRIKEEFEWDSYLFDDSIHKITKALPMNYKRQLREYETLKTKAHNGMKEKLATLKRLEEQLEKGV